ncbi:MAG TPA: hypothetical protein VK145_00900 [Candidatus Nanoarchaeia archaeon]|nr:hypothetical protein [Candidatus Nanoarchaeia archaeon]
MDETTKLEASLRKELGQGWIFPGDAQNETNSTDDPKDIRVLLKELGDFLWLAPDADE